MIPGDEIKDKIVDINKRKEDLTVQSSNVRENIRNFCADNAERLSEVGVVRGVAQYWVWLQLVDNISTDLVLATETGTPEEMVTSFSSIREINTSLSESKCQHLQDYVSKTTKYWQMTIQTKLVAELEEALDSLGWPFIQLGDTKKMKMDAGKSVSIQELQELVKCLILIQENDEVDNKSDDEMNVTHPMKIMLKPLRKRFKYHFLGTKTSNNPAKPEWFTTQLVLWANLHKTFLEANVQPVYDKLEILSTAKTEFCYGLVCLAREKLSVDLPIVFNDDVLLAHTIDEAIALTRDLCGHLEYSSSQPSPLSPLTAPLVFSRWINMERKFAFEKLDNVVCGEGAWQSDVGDNLVPSAAQSFLSILLSVTERYKFLTHSEHRLQFLELQLQLLEDFRVRLVQLVRSENDEPLQTNFCPILCTVHHLIQVLSNWAETPFFLQLEFQKNADRNKDMTGTVFDDVINKFEYLMTDMVSTIINSVMFSIRSNSRQYRKDIKWFSLTVTSDSVHPSFCNILQDVAFYLETVVKIVPDKVFTRLWMELAADIGKFICEDVILVNSFNVGGARQLQFDIQHGLLPIFGEFTSCPQAHFPVLMVSNIIKYLPYLMQNDCLVSRLKVIKCSICTIT